MSALPELLPHQLLAIADAFCDRYGTQVTDLSAIAVSAGTPTARIDGLALHGTATSGAKSLARMIVATAPLSAENEVFAAFAAQVYLTFARGYGEF